MEDQSDKVELLILYKLRDRSFSDIGGLRYLALGAIIAVLLCSIGTVLLSRLSSADFLVSVKVRDVWGAIATGFVIQWFGLKFIADQIVGSSTESAPVSNEIDSNGAMDQSGDNKASKATEPRRNTDNNSNTERKKDSSEQNPAI